MLFTEFNVDDALEVRYEEGVEKGMVKGLAKGEYMKLIQLVLRKLKKEKSPAEIAEELEEDVAIIQRICQAAGQCGLEPDGEQIYRMITQYTLYTEIYNCTLSGQGACIPLSAEDIENRNHERNKNHAGD